MPSFFDYYRHDFRLLR